MALLSPSTRRAWIERLFPDAFYYGTPVALHPEGVDRNTLTLDPERIDRYVALHPEGVDRNTFTLDPERIDRYVALHPEGVDRNCLGGNGDSCLLLSPSTRRAWIEIPRVNQYTRAFLWSPSTRRAWIEIDEAVTMLYALAVALHPEGVDRNF